MNKLLKETELIISFWVRKCGLFANQNDHRVNSIPKDVMDCIIEWFYPPIKIITRLIKQAKFIINEDDDIAIDQIIPTNIRLIELHRFNSYSFKLPLIKHADYVIVIEFKYENRLFENIFCIYKVGNATELIEDLGIGKKQDKSVKITDSNTNNLITINLNPNSKSSLNLYLDNIDHNSNDNYNENDIHVQGCNTTVYYRFMNLIGECIVTYDDFAISNMIEYTYDEIKDVDNNDNDNSDNNNDDNDDDEKFQCKFYLSFCSYNAFLYYKQQQFEQWLQMIDSKIEYSNHMTKIKQLQLQDKINNGKNDNNNNNNNNGLPVISKTFTNRLIEKLIKRGLPTHITDPIAFVVPKYIENGYFDNLKKMMQEEEYWDYNVELRDKKLHIPIKLARKWNVSKRDYDLLQTNLNGVPTDKKEQQKYWQTLLDKIGKK